MPPRLPLHHRLRIHDVAFALSALALVTVWIVRVHHFAAFRFDDTFMTLRYARNLVEHGVLSFNIDDRVDGFTSPAWTLSMALLTWLGLEGERAMTLCSTACGGVAMLAAVALARRLGAPRSWALVAGAGTVSGTGFLVWSASGMETAFCAAIACISLSMALAPVEARSTARAWLQAALLVVCALSRPENALLAGMLLLHSAVSGWRLPQRSTSERIRFLAPMLCAGALLALLFTWHWSYYGYPLPNTYYAKAATPELLTRGRDDLEAFLRASFLWLAPIAAVGIGLDRMRRTPSELASLGIFALWFLAVCVQYARAGGDHMGYWRFFQPLVPAGYAMVAACTGRWLLRATTSLPRVGFAPWIHPVLGMGVGACVILASHTDISTAWARDSQQIRSGSATVEKWRAAGIALRRHLPASTSMSIRAAGVIPYVTNFRSFDTLGLNNQDVAHNSPATGKVPGHQREATPKQIVAWRPDIIVNHPVIERENRRGKPPRFFNRPEYSAAGYTYECLKSRPKQWICFWLRPTHPHAS